MARGPKGVPEPLSQTADEGLAIERSSSDGRPMGIKDIGGALGIAIGRGDRAIHARGGINAITKERVVKMSQTLGYRPNLAARYLKAPRQIRVSVNLPARIGSFFDAVRGGIRDASSPFQAGVNLEFRTHPALGEGDEDLFRAALEDNSKGIMIAPGHPPQLNLWILLTAHTRD